MALRAVRCRAAAPNMNRRSNRLACRYSNNQCLRRHCRRKACHWMVINQIEPVSNIVCQAQRNTSRAIVAPMGAVTIKRYGESTRLREYRRCLNLNLTRALLNGQIRKRGSKIRPFPRFQFPVRQARFSKFAIGGFARIQIARALIKRCQQAGL